MGSRQSYENINEEPPRQHRPPPPPPQRPNQPPQQPNQPPRQLDQPPQQPNQPPQQPNPPRRQPDRPREEQSQHAGSCKEDKKYTVECMSCLEKLDSDHPGIRCVQGHHFCLDACSKQYTEYILNEPILLLPPKCPTCKVEIKSEILIRVMTTEQVDRFNTLMMEIVWSKKMMHKEELLVHCPNCSYFEYRAALARDILFIHCKKDGCEAVTCFTCKQTVDVEEEEEDVELQEMNMATHFKCAEMSDIKQQFDAIVSKGNTVACPNCLVAGMKDDACSHMTCQNCEAEWCYVCGKVSTELDMGTPENIYSHFDDWHKNPKRCPMYVYSIANIDEGWSDDAKESMEMFHRRRTLMLLKEFYDEIGEEAIRNLYAHFDSVSNCGFTIDDIKKAPKEMFTRVDDDSDDDW